MTRRLARIGSSLVAFTIALLTLGAAIAFTPACAIARAGADAADGATLASGLFALRPGAQSSTPEITILSSDDRAVHLTFELPAVEIEHFDVQGADYQILSFAEGELMGAPGEPALPAYSRFIEIPANSGVSVTVLATEEEVLRGARVLPMQDVDGSVFALNEELYGRDEWLGGETAAIGAPALMRDLRVASLALRPVRYNPARGEVRILKRVEVEVRFAGLDARNVRPDRAVPLTRDFDGFYGSSVLNYEHGVEGARSGSGATLGTWVLIYRDNSEALALLQPLIEWRQRMGFKVRVASTAETGTTNTAIRSWLISAYNTWPDPPEFVCLAGDASGSYSIPTFHEGYSGYDGEGDHPYSQLAGTDDVPEVFIGRLSFETTTQLETIVAKILDYEKTPYLTNPSWFKAACLVGDASGSGLTCVQIQQWLKERMRNDFGYARIDTIFSSPFVSRMSSSVNAGVSFFGYRGYLGMSGWEVGSITALNNARRCPFALNLTCGTGSFESETSINEAWLRAGSPTNLIGGIGSIATATWGTHTRYNNCYYHGVAHGFFWDNLFRIGQAQAMGKLEMVLDYGAWEPNEVSIFCYWNTLMGDPATDMWTDVPQQLTVTHPTSMPMGSDVVTVTVTHDASPVAGAWVYLHRAGEIEIGAYTDANGQVDLPISTTTAGNVLVTVTGHGLYAYTGSISISQATHFVGLAFATIDDDGAAPSHGNGDHAINPGETIVPSIYLSNFGTAVAPSVTLTAACDDPYIALMNPGPIAYGDIAAGVTLPPLGYLTLRVSPGAPNGHTFRIDLTAQSESYSWNSILDLQIVAPQLSHVSHALTGCGTLLDPGETCTMTVTLRNEGSVTAYGPIHAQLITDSYAVDVTDASGTYANSIGAGGTATNTGDVFALSSPADCIPGLLAHLRLALTFADGVRDTVEFAMPVGAADAADPTGPDTYGYLAYDNTDAGYAEKPTYSWIDLPGVGQLVGLTDNGDGQDDVVTVDLPFPFQYYGETFTRVSICSNGWIAMGSTYLTDYRNWYMPGGGGPANQIAPFWDDLYQTSSGKVYQWFDAANHRYVVAWDNVRMLGTYGNYPESFELILYDPAYYPTYTGDGAIVFQYEIINNSDTVQEYCTIGIQNYDHSDGITYSYFNTQPATAAVPQAGRAIKFTTRGPGASSVHSNTAQPELRLVMAGGPNPFRTATTIRFSIDRERPVRLQVFDIDGRLVNTLLDGPVGAGEQHVPWAGVDQQGNPLPAGVYFYKLEAGDHSATQKLLLLR
jgi:hypothetical protein